MLQHVVSIQGNRPIPDLRKQGDSHRLSVPQSGLTVHLLIGRFSVRVRAEEQVRAYISGTRFTISSPSGPETPDDLPPHPDDYRDENGVTDYERWQAALAVWRGADTETAPPVNEQGRDGE